MEDNGQLQPVSFRSLDCVGYPAYRVGDDGSVWSCQKAVFLSGRKRKQTIGDTWKMLTGKPHRDGHIRVVLCNDAGKKTFQVHRLLLCAFVGPPPEGMIACHSDGNPANNTLTNLRWDTPESNYRDRDLHGATAKGERHGRTPFTEDDVRDIRKQYAQGDYYREIANRYGVAGNAVWKIVKRKSWKHVV